VNHRITQDGDGAEMFSKGYALNILERHTGSGLWEVWGDYTHTLERLPDGWKCSGMTFVVTHVWGNEMARDFVAGWQEEEAGLGLNGARHGREPRHRLRGLPPEFARAGRRGSC
jgi:hypothetical protein